MNNWISYFEQYHTDKKLYEMLCIKLESELRTGRQSKYSEQIRLKALLEKQVLTAEKRLENYVEEGLAPSEVVKQSEEKMFLYYRYACGMSMFETARAMSISRDTVYRIRRRILKRHFPY